MFVCLVLFILCYIYSIKPGWTSCAVGTYRGGGYAAGVSQPFLHPHRGVQESLHAKIPEDRPEVPTHLTVGHEFLIKCQPLCLLWWPHDSQENRLEWRFQLYHALLSENFCWIDDFNVTKTCSIQPNSTIIFLRQLRELQSLGLKRLWAPLMGSARNSPIGTVPEHHSKTPLRCEKGTTCGAMRVIQTLWVKGCSHDENRGITWIIPRTKAYEIWKPSRIRILFELRAKGWKQHVWPCSVWCWAFSCECLCCAGAAWSTCWRPAASRHPAAGHPGPVHNKRRKRSPKNTDDTEVFFRVGI